MRHLTFSWQGLTALLLCLAALITLPLLAEGAARPFTDGTASLVFIIVAAAALLSFAPQPPAYRATVLFIGAHGAAWMLLSALSGNEGMATRAFFLLLFALLAAGLAMRHRAVETAARHRLRQIGRCNC